MGLWGWEHERVGWGTEGHRDRTGGIVGTAVGSGAQNGTAGTGCGIGPRGRGGLGCGDGMWSNGAEGCGAVIRSCGDGGSGQTMGAADNGVGVAGMWGGADGGGTACGPPRGRSGGRAMGHGPQGVGTPISPPPHIPSPPAAARSFAPSIPGRSPSPRPIRAAAGDGRGDAEGHREPSGSAPVGVGDGERSAFLGCPLRNPLSTGRRGSDVLRVRTGREVSRGDGAVPVTSRARAAALSAVSPHRGCGARPVGRHRERHHQHRGRPLGVAMEATAGDGDPVESVVDPDMVALFDEFLGRGKDGGRGGVREP